MRKYFFLIAIILVCIPAFAQEYNLEELIEAAWKNSYQAEYARYESKTAKSNLRQNWFRLLPASGLSFSKRFDYDALDYDQSAWSLSHSLKLNDPNYFNIITSQNTSKSKQLALAQQRKSTAFDVLKLYSAVVIAQKEADIYRQNLELQQNITAQTEIMYDNGKASLLDLQQSRITELDYTISLKSAEVALSSARSSLFAYLNISDEGYEFDDIDLASDAIDTYKVSNYLLKMKKLNLKNSKVNLLYNRLNFLQDISLNYIVYHSSYDDLTNWDEYYRNENYLSINISFDICGIAVKRETCLQSRYNLDLMKRDLENYKNILQSNVKKLKAELDNLLSEKDMYQQKLLLAEQNYQLARTQYELGTIGLLDLDKAVISLANARLEENRSLYDYIIKQEELNVLLSQPVLGKW